MSRRRPTKAERERVVTLDLLADWRAYAEPLPAPKGEHDWRFYGTITRDGVTGALAWRAGGYGVGNGTDVRELGLWDRIKVTALLMDDPPGYTNSPRFRPLEPSVWPENRC
jgi:hypothetical protein